MSEIARPLHLPRIGCAGWALPKDRRSFGAGESVLAQYATRFDCVEINSSFYRPHQRETYRRWADSVPAGFRFLVKLPATITHELRLRGAGSALDAFFEQAGGLRQRLGGVLVQLPPSLAFDARSVAAFFASLRRRYEGRIALEPRHRSWFEGEAAAALLERHRVARVAADPAPAPAGADPGGSTRWRYWRWHGSPRVYYSAYEDARLRELAGQLCRRGSNWCIFDNTAAGHAVPDALRLQAMCAKIIAARSAG
jgi:uncharacterized protein YecE (DUF72 family)